MKSRILLALSIGILIPCSFGQQGAVEVVGNSHRPLPYPSVWPSGPARGSIPDWAVPGKIRFSRWDGGRIETAKAFLSGWPGLNPPDPNLLYTMTNWYDPSTVRFLKEADINLVWLTFSVGFSNQTEARHQAEVRRYIEECHRQGIHVMAYESIGNMFWEDMFEVAPKSKNWVAHGSDGKPIPYGAGTYTKMGRVTRYMADFQNPEWRDYLLKRIDLAIESGADGLMYDNNFGNALFELYPQLFQHATSLKKDFLLMANFHADTYVLNRMLNCMTTEDGVEPGLHSSSSAGYTDLKPHFSYWLPVGDKFLVNNIGLLRIQETLSEGWKPVMVEDGRREHLERMVGLVTPGRAQLSLAEKMMFSIAHEQYIEGRPADQLIHGDPLAVNTWRAIGKYNRFFREQEDIYVGSRSTAPLAIILDDRSDGVPLLDGLAARGVLFEVLYEKDVTRAALSRYRAVAILSARMVRDSAIAALEDFVRKGGRLVSTGNSATLAEGASTRTLPAFFQGATGSGKGVHFDTLPLVEELAKTLREVSGPLPARIDAPATVLYNVTRQNKRVIVHLLNYALMPANDLKVEVPGTFRSARVVSPDDGGSFAVMAGLNPHSATIQIPKLQIYSAVILESK